MNNQRKYPTSQLGDYGEQTSQLGDYGEQTSQVIMVNRLVS